MADLLRSLWRSTHRHPTCCDLIASSSAVDVGHSSPLRTLVGALHGRSRGDAFYGQAKKAKMPCKSYFSNLECPRPHLPSNCFKKKIFSRTSQVRFNCRDCRLSVSFCVCWFLRLSWLRFSRGFVAIHRPMQNPQSWPLSEAKELVTTTS